MPRAEYLDTDQPHSLLDFFHFPYRGSFTVHSIAFMTTFIMLQSIRSRVAELKDPKCAVPRHDPARRRKHYTEYIPWVTVRRLQSREIPPCPTSVDGTPQYGSRLSGSTQTRPSNGARSETTDITHQNGHLETSIPDNVDQGSLIQPSAQQSQAPTVQMNGRNIVSRLTS